MRTGLFVRRERGNGAPAGWGSRAGPSWPCRRWSRFLLTRTLASFHSPTSFTGGHLSLLHWGGRLARASHDLLNDAVADRASYVRRPVDLRKLTNLRTNILETTADTAYRKCCKQHFTPESFSPRPGLLDWRTGAAGTTPRLTTASSGLGHRGLAACKSCRGARFTFSIHWTRSVPGMIAWAFGWCVGVRRLFHQFPVRESDGAFLRWDWLFWTISEARSRPRAAPGLVGSGTGVYCLRIRRAVSSAHPATNLPALLRRRRLGCSCPGAPTPT